VPKLPRITAREAAARLTSLGFRLARQTGSHKRYVDMDGRAVTIPFHGSKILHPKTLKDIMRQAGITEW